MSDLRPLDPDYAARVRGSFARQAFMRTLGVELVRLAPGEVDLAMPHRPELTQQHGYFHAGATATIADSAAGYAALSLYPPRTGVLTTEFKINLLSPAQGELFRAVGRVVRPGRKLMVCLGEVFAEAGGTRKQVALMTASMMVVDGATGLRD
jgi:uncharacterized protein (TIGR00369 family)